MPWQSRDARHHTKKARSMDDKEYWARIANAVLHRSGDDHARAVRIANGVLAKRVAARKRKKAVGEAGG